MAKRTITDPEALAQEAHRALAWLVENTPAERWPELVQALQLVRSHSGHGRITLLVKDNRLADHPKVEISL